MQMAKTKSPQFCLSKQKQCQNLRVAAAMINLIRLPESTGQ